MKYTDKKINSFVINNLTEERYTTIKENSETKDDEFYLTPDSGLIPNKELNRPASSQEVYEMANDIKANDNLFLTGIEIIANPDMMIYNSGSSFDTTGMRVYAYFDRKINGEISKVYRELNINELSISPAILKEGNEKVTLSYTNRGRTQTTSLEVTIVPIVSYITVKKENLPKKMEYFYQDKVDINDIKVTVVYTNNQTKEIDFSQITYEPLYMEDIGNQNITFYYEENGILKSNVIVVNVLPKRLLSPVYIGKLTYTGKELAATFRYDSAVQQLLNEGKITFDDKIGINAGRHSTIFTINDVKYIWEENLDNNLSVYWWIDKAVLNTGFYRINQNNEYEEIKDELVFHLQNVGYNSEYTTSYLTDKIILKNTFEDLNAQVTFKDEGLCKVTEISLTDTFISFILDLVSEEASGETTLYVKILESDNFLEKNLELKLIVDNPLLYGVGWEYEKWESGSVEVGGESNSRGIYLFKSEEFTESPIAYYDECEKYGSPFDKVKPWSEVTEEEDEVAGVLVKIPKFYYAWRHFEYTEDSGESKPQYKYILLISPTWGRSLYTSPAHADRNDGQGERDFVYVGKYQCAAGSEIPAGDAEDKFKSLRNKIPIYNYNTTTQEVREGVRNLGDEYYLYDYAMFWTIMLLYLGEYADWDSQRTIGIGLGYSGTHVDYQGGNIEEPVDIDGGLTGGSTSMPYHTGTMGKKEIKELVYAEDNSYDKKDNFECLGFNNSLQYRFIEDLNYNGKSFVDGFYLKTVKTDPTGVGRFYSIINTNLSPKDYGTDKNLILLKRFETARKSSSVSSLSKFLNNVIKEWEFSNIPNFEYFLIPSVYYSPTYTDKINYNTYEIYSPCQSYVGDRVVQDSTIDSSLSIFSQGFFAFYREEEGSQHTSQSYRLMKLPNKTQGGV